MFHQIRNFKVRIPFPLIDVYLFRWGNIFSSSGIHNHAKHGCILFLLKGELKETLYGHQLNKLKSTTFKAPTISYMHNLKGYHNIKPIKQGYSLHFYYPKGFKTKYITINNIE